MKPETPRLAVDAAIIAEGELVLIKRRNPPYQGMWALPGGFVDVGETVEEAVKREAQEETNLKIKIKKLVGVYSNPERDPRGHTVSLIYLCKKISGKLKPGDDAKQADWFPLKKTPPLAFDHGRVIQDIQKTLKP
ncbi:MAG: NUDIX domain-containing protein [Candidatus Altiarchaeales archaeon]|nr:NUDIX domain-containing protein [Candidatus Altiarchaeales archaeon]